LKDERHQEAEDKLHSEDYLIDEIMTNLGERKQTSKATYRKILRALGSHITWRLLGDTLQSHREGVVRKGPPAYFIGLAKMTAKELGVDLGFRS